MLSFAEKAYFKASLSPSCVREDGRTALSRRPLDIRAQAIPKASGSALLTSGKSRLAAVITASLSEQPTPVRVRFTPENLQLSTLYMELLSVALPKDALVILEDSHYWSLLVEIHTFWEEGNLLEHAFLALRTALLSLQLPKMSIERNMESGEVSLLMESITLPLDLGDFPTIVVKYCCDGTWFVDPTKGEEACADACILWLTNSDSIMYMRKMGSGLLTDIPGCDE